MGVHDVGALPRERPPKPRGEPRVDVAWRPEPRIRGRRAGRAGRRTDRGRRRRDRGMSHRCRARGAPAAVSADGARSHRRRARGARGRPSHAPSSRFCGACRAVASRTAPKRPGCRGGSSTARCSASCRRRPSPSACCRRAEGVSAPGSLRGNRPRPAMAKGVERDDVHRLEHLTGKVRDATGESLPSFVGVGRHSIQTA